MLYKRLKLPPFGWMAWNQGLWSAMYNKQLCSKNSKFDTLPFETVQF